MARINRREMMATLGTVPVAVAASANAAAAPPAQVGKNAIPFDGQDFRKTRDILVAAHPLEAEKFQRLSDPRTRDEYLKAVSQVVQYLSTDAYARAAFLESADAATLTLLYNANAARLEPLLGKIDGRTREGRLAKVVHAAELFAGASGTDRSHFTTGEGGNRTQDMAELVDSSSSSSCSGCDVGGLLLGCCIIHFWGWTSGGCC
jgi:hypothetical protein